MKIREMQLDDLEQVMKLKKGMSLPVKLSLIHI